MEGGCGIGGAERVAEATIKYRSLFIRRIDGCRCCSIEVGGGYVQVRVVKAVLEFSGGERKAILRGLAQQLPAAECAGSRMRQVLKKAGRVGDSLRLICQQRRNAQRVVGLDHEA